jgi:hypothetical protein
MLLVDAGITWCYSTGLQGWKISGSSLSRGLEFFTSPPCPDQLWGPPSLLSNGYEGFFPWGVKQLACEADHSLPPIPPLPQHAFMVLTVGGTAQYEFFCHHLYGRSNTTIQILFLCKTLSFHCVQRKSQNVNLA